MSQYCFSVEKKIKSTDIPALKLFVENLYKKNISRSNAI